MKNATPAMWSSYTLVAGVPLNGIEIGIERSVDDDDDDDDYVDDDDDY